MDATLTPTIDYVTLLATNGLSGNITFSIGSELMKNQQLASPIEPTQNMLVVQDSQGRPMIFTIGTDQKFHLLKSDDATATGWTVIDLSAGFDASYAAQTFDVTQDRQGRISVVVALQKKGAPGTDVFSAALLSNDYAHTDWGQLASLSQPVGGIDPGFVAEHILLGPTDDGQAPFTVINGALNGQQYYYQVLGAGQLAQKFEFPENVAATSMLDMSLGNAFGQRGVFFLYKIGDTQTLECTTLADPSLGAMSYDYSAGNQHLPAPLRDLRYNCLATPQGSQTVPTMLSSDIFVGTDGGVYLFRDAKAASLQVVTDQLADVHEILVTEDTTNISLWVLCSPSQLYYISGKKGSTYTWNAPVLFSQSVVHLAPMRSRSRQANELFLVNQDRSISHYWQDPGSTLWQQRLLKVPGSNYVLDFNSFTTHIHLADANGNSLGGKPLRVTAAEWTYVTANGLVYSLDKDTPATIPTDERGTITLINMADSVATPILHVEGDFFAQTLNIYPNGKIQRGLQAIRSGDDLKNARTQDNQPVVSSGLDDNTLAGVATNLSQLTDATAQYQAGTRAAGNVFVSVDEAGVKHTGRLSVAHLPDDFAVGMTLQNGSWQPHTADSLAAAMGRTAAPAASLARASASGVLGTLEDWAGDALHWLETAFADGLKLVEQGVTYLKDGVSFVIHKIEDGLQMVLTIGEKILNIALNTFSSVFKALNWVLKLVGLALEKVLAWLGHLFGWDDIWQTHKVIAAVLNSGLDYVVGAADRELDTWRAAIDDALSSVGEKVKNLVLPTEIATANPQAAAAGIRQGQPAANLNSPQANFSFYQMQHGGMLQGAADALTTNNPFAQFVNDIVVPTAQTLATALQKDLADFQRLCTDSGQTYQNLATLLGDLVDTVVQPLRTLIDGFLNFVKDFLNDVRGWLQGEVDIPFLGSFYSFVTGLLGESEPLTVVNAVSLLLAVPLTIISKAVLGHAPFSGDLLGVDQPGLFDRLRNEGAAAPAPQLAMRSLAAAAPAAMETTNAAASDMAKFRAFYTQVGGLIAPLAGVAASISGFFAAGQGVQGNKLNTGQKFQLGFAACKYACSFPVPKPGQPGAAYGLKATAYGIGVLNTAISPAITSLPVRGGVLAGVDFIILVLAVVGDALGKDPAWNYVTDISSNVGGVVQGTAQAFEQPEIAMLGAGISYLGGALVGFVHALTTLSDAANYEVVQMVNVAG